MSIRAYDAEGDAAKENSAPAVAAVYWWVYDFGLLIQRDSAHIEEQMWRFFNQRGRKFEWNGDPFLWLDSRAKRPVLAAGDLDELTALFAAGGEHAKLLAQVATELQRPLYVGMTSDFGARLVAHLEERSGFAIAVDQVDLRDCIVRWIPIQDATFDALSGTLDPQLLNASSDERAEAALRRSVSLAEVLLIRTAMPLFNVRMGRQA